MCRSNKYDCPKENHESYYESYDLDGLVDRLWLYQMITFKTTNGVAERGNETERDSGSILNQYSDASDDENYNINL